MDELMTGAPDAGSPSATETAPETPPAGAQPVSEPPFHQHPRWQQLMQERATERQALIAAHQKLRDVEQRLAQQQPAQNGQPKDPELAQALEAIEKVFNVDPSRAASMMAKLLGVDLKTLQALSKAAPHMVAGLRNVADLRGAQVGAMEHASRNHVMGLMTRHGMPQTREALEAVEALVAYRIQSNPQALADFKRGSLAPLEWAFSTINAALIGPMKQPAQTAAAKDAVRRLPPASRAGTPGQPAPPKLERGKEREFTERLSDMSRKMFDSMGA